MLRDLWIDDFAPIRLECGERALLVDAHQPAIADDIGRKDGSKPPFERASAIKIAPTHRDLKLSLWSGAGCVYRAAIVTIAATTSPVARCNVLID